MDLPRCARIGHIRLIERLISRAVVAPTGKSLRLLALIGREVRNLHAEIENDLRLEQLLVDRLTIAARRPSAEDRTMLDEPTPFDDGEHLVKEIPSAVYERLT